MAIARSYLFVPATRIERVPKAHAAGAHAVIVDLEDAVAPQDKARARDAAAQLQPGAGPVYVRVNAPETEWFEDDLALCRALAPAGIVVPKAERAEHLSYAADFLAPHAVLLPLIESARGFAAAGALCAGPRVQRVVFGSIDFQLDLGIDGEGEELVYFRSALVLASKLAGLQPPVDTVSVVIDDEAPVRHDTLRARRMGFGAKLCIHPRQVSVVNACFQPTGEEVAWARRIVEAAGAANGAAVAVDGRMVDTPVLVRAQNILAEAEGR